MTLTDAPDRDIREVDTLCKNVNDRIFERTKNSDVSSFFVNASADGDLVIEIKMSKYRSDLVSQETRQDVMQIALEEVQSSSISRANRNKIYNELCALDETTSNLVRQLSEDVQSDFVGAYSTFRPFSGFFGWALGVLALGMFMTLGLTIVLDLTYINLPFMQLILHGTKDNEKPRLVSLEAYSAVREADSKAGEAYVSPNGIYLKHKGKQLVMVSVCILYLTSGRLYELVATCIDYFRGILG